MPERTEAETLGWIRSWIARQGVPMVSPRTACTNALRLLLLVLLAAPGQGWSHLVRYTFSGHWGAVNAAVPVAPITQGDAFDGTVFFDSDAPRLLTGDENASWFSYRSSGRVLLQSGNHVWSNAVHQDHSLCSVEMGIYYLEIRFVCHVATGSEWPGVLVLHAGIPFQPNVHGMPYPLGPFVPESFPEQGIDSALWFIGDGFSQDRGFATRSSASLTEVRFIGEPSVLPLMGCLVLIWLYARRRLGARPGDSCRGAGHCG